jgi:hypothetical protein
MSEIILIVVGTVQGTPPPPATFSTYYHTQKNDRLIHEFVIKNKITEILDTNKNET